MAALVLLPLALATPGCQRADGAGAGFSERDSAGIHVAESAAPSWTAGDGWRVDPVPSATIGAVDGPPAYQFHQVAGVARLSDGTIVVADAGSSEVRFYDTAGRHLRSVGGAGDGPGEYRTLAGLVRLGGDSLAVWDFRARRVTYLAPDGAFVRGVSLRGTEGMFPEFRGVAGDGRVVVSSGFSPMLLMGAEAGERRDPVSFLLFGPNGAFADTLGRFPGTEGYLQKSETTFGYHPLVFGRSVHFTLAPDGLWAADDDRGEVVLHGLDGTPRRIVRRGVEPRPAGRDALERHWRARYAEVADAAPDTRARVEAELQALRAVLPARESFPHFSALRRDSEGNLWLREYPVSPEDERAWSVIDQEGRWLGEVRMPAGLEVAAIGADWVVGIWKDELDVQHVRLHPLRKGGS